MTTTPNGMKRSPVGSSSNGGKINLITFFFFSMSPFLTRRERLEPSYGFKKKKKNLLIRFSETSKTRRKPTSYTGNNIFYHLILDCRRRLWYIWILRNIFASHRGTNQLDRMIDAELVPGLIWFYFLFPQENMYWPFLNNLAYFFHIISEFHGVILINAI